MGLRMTMGVGGGLVCALSRDHQPFIEYVLPGVDGEDVKSAGQVGAQREQRVEFTILQGQRRRHHALAEEMDGVLPEVVSLTARRAITTAGFVASGKS